MQTVAVADSLAPFRRHLQATIRSLAQRERLLAVIGAFGATVAAAILAPDGADLWDWVRLFLIVATASLCGADLASARDLRAAEEPRLTVALAATLVALALAATFGLRTAALCSIVLSVVDAALLSDRLRRAPELAVATLAVLIPSAVWTALDVWDDRLLLLAPLAVLALNGTAHSQMANDQVDSHSIRSAQSSDSGLSPHGHHLGAWLSLGAAAVLVLLVGIVSDVENGWLAAGGLVSGIALILGRSVPTPARGRLQMPLLLLAFFALGVCWLASL